MAPPHFLLVSYPAQGHINPTLRLAKRLIRTGAQVTFVTTVYAQRRMVKPLSVCGLSFAPFSDGYDDGCENKDNLHHVLSEIKRQGTRKLTELVLECADQGRPVACIVYTMIFDWAQEVARRVQVLSAYFWNQATTVFDIYYYYFNGYGDEVRNKSIDPSSSIELPGLEPLFTSPDLPSFLLSSNKLTFVLESFQKNFEALSQDENPKVLLNTFDALEPKALRALDKLKLIGIGPLIPSAFLDTKDPTDISFGGDLFQGSTDYIEWLNSKPKSSVIYISFGSLAILSKPQMEEIACGLLNSDRPFLWVIREPDKGEVKDEEMLGCREELEQRGMIVPWCSQLEVLTHPSLGCFVTHCGWNSTLESMVCGVPVVAFPQGTDQATNAKLITDMWKTGIRVRVNEEGMVERDEIKMCLEIVMGDGERAERLRRNAEKWKELAREAMKNGGISDNNLKAFVDEVGQKL
ncbi:Crocetin glucosyltransferase, chloroplastic [Vitis vinifera]|uniref:Glycosyltransferase n=1 Tax=Vitis vinifera TaxID=29760 RepID=A0A438CCR9_VITVI|nr:Crocetin glucosyltransferase, chloroplastic [Vitis vinifera]